MSIVCLIWGNGAHANLRPWLLLDSDHGHKIMSTYLNALSTGQFKVCNKGK